MKKLTVQEMGSRGGKARAANKTAKELTAIGKKGAAIRWAGHVAKSRKKKVTATS